MEVQKYLTTGELAKMLNISKQTVIYYDKIGLLKPAGRGSQSYRYYSREQADELDSILTFRNLGVPIDDLKQYLQDKNLEQCISLLKRQQQYVEEELERLSRIQRKIKGRLPLLEQVLQLEDTDEITYEEQPEEWYLMEYNQEDADHYLQCFINICSRAQQLGIDFENPTRNVMPKEELENGTYKRIEYCAIPIPKELTSETPCRLKPAGLYAATYHKGPIQQRRKTYERLVNDIRENGYEICGDAYEMDLLSTMTSQENEYLKKIFVQVRPKD